MADFVTSLALLFILGASSLSRSAFGHNLLNCDTASPHASSWYSCVSKLQKCRTFAALRTNSEFNKLSKVRDHLSVDRDAVAAASGLPADAESVPEGGLLLVPIDCRCNGSFYEATLLKTCVQGDSFRSIALSLQGLTTCLDIKVKIPQVSGQNLSENVQLVVPFRCSCPEQGVSNADFFVSYPMSDLDSISSLALQFNTSEDAILSANNGSRLVPFTTVLIPLDHKPVLDPLAKPYDPKSHNALVKHHTSKRARKKRLYIAVGCTIAGLLVLSIALVFGYLYLKKRSQRQTQGSISNKDPETQQLSLSVRTTSDKKVSFEGSQDGSMDCQNTVGTTTPRKRILEIFAYEDLERATENFSSSNHIEGSVYHGLFKGKDLAIQRVSAETMKKVDFGLLSDQSYFNHRLVKVLGTCFRENDEDCYLVFEYAKNGSLRDWIQNKLAIKNQFIESCYCFLAWKQRIRICLDVSTALKYMHQINYVHSNLKSRNIFLDEDLRAKVGNFGMWKCVKDKADGHSSSTPENIREGSVSAATDVFAYGIIVLEVLTGQTPETLLGTQETLVEVREKLRYIIGEKELLRELMDSALGESYSVDSAFEMASIARDCIAEEPASRPTASHIAHRIARLVQNEEEEEEEEEEEDKALEKESTLVSESSCKPLVNKVVDE